MARFNYLLSYSPFALSPNSQQVQVLVSNTRNIESWYLAFPGTYLLKSDLSLVELNMQFSQFFGATPYVLSVAQVVTGALPPNVWQWFNNTLNPFLPGS